ncbi:YgaP family membrane protein [Rubrobacter tropicus]|uniref:YgaP family membrane protein n=1 Tax=Rubrobacter tropicus TaxID=2653851 RepID=UPI001A9D3962|nr:DUF2892 domain-containing protein [Rubrobacter tropicus]
MARKVQNVGTAERWLRIVGGGLAALVGLMLLLPVPASVGAGVLGLALVLLGSDFVYTGVTGYCPLYNKLGWSTARAGGGPGRGRPRPR